jgi:murein DD-endopeptidase MepM/ murein hydrolase activator NlpD
MTSQTFDQFLHTQSKEPLRVIDTAITIDRFIKIDLTENNKDLLNFDVSSSKEWMKYITSYLKQRVSDVAFGGYLEKRNLYDRSKYFKDLENNDQRNIHLGIDLWCDENTKVLAVMDGVVHSFKNNNNYGDYGPTIILKHQIDHQEFYTLYGHLSISSINKLIIGTKFSQGDTIGYLGDSKVNGDYAPHLHFQIIRDLADYMGDYPGVCSEKNIELFKKNCPDPNLLLKLKNSSI